MAFSKIDQRQAKKTARRIKKEKKILRSKREIAALNGHKGYAFDVPKIAESVYEDYRVPRGLPRARMIMSYLESSTNLLSKFVVLVRTDKGIYLLGNVVSVVRNLELGSEYIKIRIESPEALQKVRILSFKILDPSKRCIAGGPNELYFRIGDIFAVNYRANI